MGRKLEVDWKESSGELKARYLREKHVARRTRLLALWHLREGKKQKEVAALIGMPLRVLERWVSWYRTGGIEAVLKRVKGHQAKGVPSKLTPLQQKALVARVQLGDFRTVWDVVEWVKARWKISYSYDGMYALMRRHQLNVKVPRPHSEKANVQRQEAWKKKNFSAN